MGNVGDPIQVSCSVNKCSFNYNGNCLCNDISLDNNGKCNRLKLATKKKKYFKLKRKYKDYRLPKQETIPKMPSVSFSETSDNIEMQFWLNEEFLKILEERIDKKIIERLQKREEIHYISYIPKHSGDRLRWQSPQITCNTTSAKEIKSWISSGQLPPLQNNKIASLGRTN